jgi:hypothetical protein
VLLDGLQRDTPADVMGYVRAALPAPGQSLDRGLFFARFAGLGRRTRGMAVQGRSLAEALRGAMLVQACGALPEAEHVGLVREAYEKGDNAEKVAVLRALPELPAPERFVEIANEACRSNVMEVFTAIACDNPYAARCFSDLTFNQLVMKAYFNDVPVARVVGLPDRRNFELARMAADFSAERRAAGRPVPADIGLVLSGGTP